MVSLRPIQQHCSHSPITHPANRYAMVSLWPMQYQCLLAPQKGTRGLQPQVSRWPGVVSCTEHLLYFSISVLSRVWLHRDGAPGSTLLEITYIRSWCTCCPGLRLVSCRATSSPWFHCFSVRVALGVLTLLESSRCTIIFCFADKPRPARSW